MYIFWLNFKLKKYKTADNYDNYNANFLWLAFLYAFDIDIR